MPLLNITVPGDPIPKGRPRSTSSGVTYTPPRTRAAEKVLAQVVGAAYRSEPTAAPVGVAVEFYCATRRRTDGDNLLKLVTDACNGLVYVDDSQITEWFARVHRGVGQDQARTEIFMWSLEEGLQG